MRAIEEKGLPADLVQILDRERVGQLVDIGIRRGRATRRKLKVGICGEHGGEPNSVESCHTVEMSYVSGSPVAAVAERHKTRRKRSSGGRRAPDR